MVLANCRILVIWDKFIDGLRANTNLQKETDILYGEYESIFLSKKLVALARGPERTGPVACMLLLQLHF